VRPPREAPFRPDESVLVGNVALYGATAGKAFLSGVAGERFAVRLCGAAAVVEGVGDHGCEYMTGGRVVVIGRTGRNFAAGMSGGYAYVLDEDGQFESRCNLDLVELEPLGPDDAATVAGLLEEHCARTGSVKARELLGRWEESIGRFVKVVPVEFRRVLEARAERGEPEVDEDDPEPLPEPHGSRHAPGAE
jgi:glutamate synthase (NADPH/NADH) large chain